MDRVEAGGGLIEKEQRRFVHERASEGEQLSHTAGKITGAGVAFCFQVGELEQSFRARRQFAPRHPASAAEEPDIFFDGQIGIKAETLRDITELRAHDMALAPNIRATDRGLAAGRMRQAAEHADRSGLARPIRAEETENRPRRDREREIIDGRDLAVRLAQSLQMDGRFCHGDCEGSSSYSLQRLHYGIDVISAKWKRKYLKQSGEIASQNL